MGLSRTGFSAGTRRSEVDRSDLLRDCFTPWRNFGSFAMTVWGFSLKSRPTDVPRLAMTKWAEMGRSRTGFSATSAALYETTRFRARTMRRPMRAWAPPALMLTYWPFTSRSPEPWVYRPWATTLMAFESSRPISRPTAKPKADILCFDVPEGVHLTADHVVGVGARDDGDGVHAGSVNAAPQKARFREKGTF